jgi:hypothetical protein
MTTQYTTILKLALPVQGELSGTWGDVVNDNITQMVEQAVAGKAVVNTWTGNSHTLTTADGTTSESRCAILELTDSGTALTGAGTVVCPTNTKLYIVDNNTAEIITVQTAAGTGVAVPVGKTMLVYCDGTNVVEGVTHANSLSLGTSTVTADKILDEDNMASDSATAIATQQSIKAYVDSQVGTVDTLSEILANGNTTGANDIDVDSAQKVQFRDADIYLNSSVDGQLDIVADTEIQIAATTVDLNGNLDVSGTALVAGVLTTTAATVFNGGFASNADSTLGTDKKVQFRDAAIYLNSSVDGQLDIVADGEVQIDTALVDINGNLDVSGTTNISGSVSFTKNAIAGVAISTTSRSSNTVTVTTSAVHGLTSGDLVNVNGVADTSFNGYFTVSVSSTTVFTYSQTGADGSSTGGTSTEVVYNLNASGTALNWMNGPLNIAANSGIDGLEITQSGSGNGLHVTGTTGLVGNTTLTGNLDISGDIDVDGTTNLDVVDIDGAVDFASTTAHAGNATFADDAKAIFGAGSDLQIYHTGSNSVIADTGTGNLIVRANDLRMTSYAFEHNFLQANESGAVTLYHNNAAKLATTATGIDVTGTVTADGLEIATSVADTGVDLTLNGNKSTNGGIGSIIFENAGDSVGMIRSNRASANDAADMLFYTQATGGANTERMRIDSSGNVGIGTSSPSSILSTSGTDTTAYSSSSVGGQDSSATLKIQNLTTAANSFASIDFNTNNNRVVNRIVSGHASSTTDGFLAFVTEGGGVPAERMRINANGLVGIGTSSPQKTLDVNGTFAISNSTTSYWDFDRDDSDGSLKIADTGTERMRIDASGNVGIGTSTITSGFKLEVIGDARFGDAVGDDAVELGWSAGGSQGFIQAYDRGASAFRPLNINNSLIVDASGNVGIGVTPEAWAAFNPVLRIKNASAGGGGALAGSGVDNFRMFANTYYDGAYKRLDTGFATQYGQESGAHVWSYAASGAGDSTITWSEAMRIDASGNLLVGKTSTAFGTEGFVYEAGAAVEVTTDSNRVMRLNRTTSDGNIIELNKDGTTVGSIGTEGGDLTIGNADTGLQFVNTSQIIRPQNLTTNAAIDAQVSLGQSAYRFKDLYLSGGVVFGTTGGAVTSKTLDDYEEGAWTPVLASDAIAGGYTTQVGKYTKIGNVVNVSFNVQMSSIGSFAGAVVTVTGLPFTAANNACEEIGTVNVKSPASALAGVSYLRVLNNGTEARLEQNSGTTTADHNCNANKIDTGTLLQGSITYLTA